VCLTAARILSMLFTLQDSQRATNNNPRRKKIILTLLRPEINPNIIPHLIVNIMQLEYVIKADRFVASTITGVSERITKRINSVRVNYKFIRTSGNIYNIYRVRAGIAGYHFVF